MGGTSPPSDAEKAGNKIDCHVAQLSWRDSRPSEWRQPCRPREGKGEGAPSLLSLWGCCLSCRHHDCFNHRGVQYKYCRHTRVDTLSPLLLPRVRVERDSSEKQSCEKRLVFDCDERPSRPQIVRQEPLSSAPRWRPRAPDGRRRSAPRQLRTSVRASPRARPPAAGPPSMSLAHMVSAGTRVEEFTQIYALAEHA